VSFNLQKIETIVKGYEGEKGALTSVLHDIQAECNYLPEDVLRYVAKKLDIPLIQVFGVATFFTAFSLKPRGKHLISVCLGTACHVRGGARILEKIERDLGIKSGETTEDLEFTLSTVNCLGACALGPIVVVDGTYHGQMTSSKVSSLMKGYQGVRVSKCQGVKERVGVGFIRPDK